MSNVQPEVKNDDPVATAKKKADKSSDRIVGGVASTTLSLAFMMAFGALVASGDKSFTFGFWLFIPLLTIGTVFTVVNILSYKEAMFDLDHASRHQVAE